MPLRSASSMFWSWTDWTISLHRLQQTALYVIDVQAPRQNPLAVNSMSFSVRPISTRPCVGPLWSRCMVFCRYFAYSSIMNFSLVSLIEAQVIQSSSFGAIALSRIRRTFNSGRISPARQCGSSRASYFTFTCLRTSSIASFQSRLTCWDYEIMSNLKFLQEILFLPSSCFRRCF